MWILKLLQLQLFWRVRFKGTPVACQRSEWVQGLISQMPLNVVLKALTSDTREGWLHHFLNFSPHACASRFLYPCSNVSLPSKSNEKRAKALTVNFTSGKKIPRTWLPLPSPTNEEGNAGDWAGVRVPEFYENKEIVSSLEMKTNWVIAPCREGSVLKVTVSQLGPFGD